MAGIYEEVEIEDMKYDPEKMTYTYPCPCGDKFTIALEELHDGEDIATCPSCTLRIKVIFDSETLMSMETAIERSKSLQGSSEGKDSADANEDPKDDAKGDAKEDK